MIEAAGLTKTYDGGVRAVDALTLSVPAGELFGFLGPNGAGKTTTIKMLVGLLTPTSGSARVAGYDLQAQSREAKQRIGYIPDNPFLYEKLTGREFLDFIADLYGMPAGRPRAQEIDRLLEMLDLAGKGDQLIGSFSRGMRQKMAMASALLHEPKALFLDEPTVGLDPSSIRRLKDILRNLCRERGVAVFLSTHTLEVAAEICDRVGVFHRGKLVALGSPAELTHDSALGRLEDVFLALTESAAVGALIETELS
ncbi:ABC transporter [Capsulimonas corticalis]|uniref:ABC transporter n=1 Tax=Capsulimonas corticalis TaxID=2219043 RepID=A0A402D303_9BACT|nr:ABC transporter ATP-binding protein [Capsulimonas corticalis]BDI28334.1 ABC transporter [Capsulimonas corticalis]